MHAVFTRNVAANLLGQKRYSWGSLRVRPYCFLLFSIVLLRPIFEPVHDDVVGRTPGEVPPPLAHRNFRRNRKRSALRGLKLSASHFKTALW